MNSENLSPIIRLDDADNVVVARIGIPCGTPAVPEGPTTLHDVPLGDKVAARSIRKSEATLRYNTIIGFAGEDVEPGCWMHSHNVLIDDFQKVYRFAQDYRCSCIRTGI